MSNTTIVEVKAGVSYNNCGQEVTECKKCGEPTDMTGTKLCDWCWELQNGLLRSGQ